MSVALVRVCVALLLALLCPGAARATIFIPMGVEDLARHSDAVIVGSVEQAGGIEENGRVFTLVTVSVEQIIKGEPGATVILKEAGGTVTGRQEIIFGTPSFTPGERVLLFLTRRPDGSLRTYQMAQGEFRIETDRLGTARAAQHFGQGTTIVIPPGGSPPSGPVLLDQLLATIRAALTGTPPPAPAATEPRSTVREATSGFTLLNNGRFFEADLGQPLSFVIDQRGDAILGPSASRQAIDDALAAWTGVDSASITLADGGLTDDLGLPCEGPHKVRFDDPENEIAPPVNCMGTLGTGGLCIDTAEDKMFNGTAFQHATRAGLTLADGWEGCDVWTPCNIAEIATHEIGHAIGLGHSSERQFESDPVLRDATMFFLAHFDGRCASLRSDDVEGLTFLYPTVMPPTIITPNPLPTGVVFQSYRVEFAASGGTGPYTWDLAGGSFPGLSLSPEGVLSGKPTAIGTGTLRILMTDSKGDSHAKVFELEVLLSTPTPTPSPTPPPAGCIGDCNGDREVTVDELIRGVNIALGTLAVDACPSFDANGGGDVTVDEIVKAVNAALSGCVA